MKICPFHQFSSYSASNFINVLCAHFLYAIFCKSQNVTRKSCRNDVRMKNLYVKTLMKLTAGQTFVSFEHTRRSMGFGKSSKRICDWMHLKQTVVNFINILQATFALIFLRQMITKPNCNLRKALQDTFIPKRMLNDQLLHAKIPKLQKGQSSCQSFLHI